jgi:hypothetical protein
MSRFQSAPGTSLPATSLPATSPPTDSALKPAQPPNASGASYAELLFAYEARRQAADDILLRRMVHSR